jgi:hypothetical protein
VGLQVMSNTQTPTGLAAATKVTLDAVKTTFGAAIVVLLFFGLTLVVLSTGAGNLEAAIRGDIIYLLIILMFITLIFVLGLRIWKPSGLAGPPQPETKQLIITNSNVDE